MVFDPGGAQRLPPRGQVAADHGFAQLTLEERQRI